MPAQTLGPGACTVTEEQAERIAVALETIAAAVTRPDNDVESSKAKGQRPGGRRRLPEPNDLDRQRAAKIAARLGMVSK